MGAVLAKTDQIEQSSAVAQEFERNGLLSELAEQICDPLQTAQSTVDLLIARLKRGPVDLVESQEELLTARTALERAIQEAYQLREVTRSRRVTLMPTDLRLVVAQVTSSFTPLCTAGGCQVRTRIAEHVPRVKVEPAEMRYALSCLLENAAQAIDRRQRTAVGEPAEGEIVVSLCADPSANRSVLITVQDNGVGIADQHLTHVFDQYFDTRAPATPGEKSATGLWAVRRFVEGIGGEITAKNILDEKGNRRGAAFQVLLPTCGDNDAPEEITL